MKNSIKTGNTKDSANDVGKSGFSPFKRITGWLSIVINGHFDRLADLRVYDDKRN